MSIKGAFIPFESYDKRMPEEVWKFKRKESSVRALKLRCEGLTAKEIALEMGVAIRTVYLYLQIGKKAIKSGELTDSQVMELGQISVPVDVQRKRLLGRLRKSDEVIGQAMDDYGINKDYAVNATRTALKLNAGLGVLKEETVSKSVTFEEKRLIISAQLGLAEQYGAEVPKEIKAEIVEEIGGAGIAPGKSSTCEERPESARAKTASPDVSRETKD